MTTVIHPRLLVAGADARVVDWAIDLLARAGIRRTTRALSGAAFAKCLATHAIDVVVLTAPMFDVLHLDLEDFDPAGPSFIILSRDGAESVHRLMDLALDQRWTVRAIVDAPAHPVSIVAALMKTLRDSDQVGIAARAR